MGTREDLKNESGEIEPLKRYELRDRIALYESSKPIRDKALISFLYLTGCRIEEVVKYIIEKYASKTGKRELKGSPIKKKQVEILEKEKKVYVNNVRCLKRNTRRNKNTYKNKILIEEALAEDKKEDKKQQKRRIPRRKIVFLITEREKYFYKQFKRWHDRLGPNDYLFDITRQRANQILKKIRIHPHHCRHIRASELATDYGFSTSELMKFFGWASDSTAKEYTHLNVNDIENKMKRMVGWDNAKEEKK